MVKEVLAYLKQLEDEVEEEIMKTMEKQEKKKVEDVDENKEEEGEDPPTLNSNPEEVSLKVLKD